jgi:nucleoside-diphosphate-sugar epimerase
MELPGIERRVVDYSAGWVDPGTVSGADALFHLGGITRALSTGDFRRGNVVPTRLLLEAAAASAGGVGRFVLMSSQAAFGPASSAHEPVTETTEPRPVEEYGQSKLAAEEAVQGSGVPFTILRPAAVYGAGDRDFALLFKQVRMGVALYATDPDGMVSVIHISDVIRGTVAAALDEGSLGESYFLTSEPPVSWRELYAIAASVAGRKPVELRVPEAMSRIAAKVGDVIGVATGRLPLVNSRKMELARARYWICSGAHAAGRLGFRAGVPLEEGLRDYVRPKGGAGGPASRPAAAREGEPSGAPPPADVPPAPRADS